MNGFSTVGSQKFGTGSKWRGLERGLFNRSTASRPFALFYEGKGETTLNLDATTLSASISGELGTNRPLAVLKYYGYVGKRVASDLRGFACVASKCSRREEHDGQNCRCGGRFDFCLLQRLRWALKTS